MDMQLLVSSILKAYGFPVDAKVLSVDTDSIVKLDFHPTDVLLYAEFDTEHGFAYNENIYINPRYRHQGIGLRLLTAYEEICREAGVTILINNNRNPGFWKRRGYRRLNPFWQMLLARQLKITFDHASVYKEQ